MDINDSLRILDRTAYRDRLRTEDVMLSAEEFAERLWYECRYPCICADDATVCLPIRSPRFTDNPDLPPDDSPAYDEE